MKSPTSTKSIKTLTHRMHTPNLIEQILAEFDAEWTYGNGNGLMMSSWALTHPNELRAWIEKRLEMVQKDAK